MGLGSVAVVCPGTPWTSTGRGLHWKHRSHELEDLLQVFQPSIQALVLARQRDVRCERSGWAEERLVVSWRRCRTTASPLRTTLLRRLW